jgi:putative tryptophan/tyrosine transport system substrate-binding protein
MRRREFLAVLAGTTLASPFVARAQAGPVIGFLHAGSPEENEKRLAAFRKGLAAGGFVEGQNVSIDYHWARGKNDALPGMAADLVRKNVAMIVTPGSTAAADAAGDGG